MKPSKAKILATAMMFGAFAQTYQKEYYEGEKHFNKEPKEPIIPKGHIHYWFRANGTFLNEKQSERMLKEDCVFKCFALNNKNAIRKFNLFKKSTEL